MVVMKGINKYEYEESGRILVGTIWTGAYSTKENWEQGTSVSKRFHKEEASSMNNDD